MAFSVFLEVRLSLRHGYSRVAGLRQQRRGVAVPDLALAHRLRHRLERRVVDAATPGHTSFAVYRALIIMGNRSFCIHSER